MTGQSKSDEVATPGKAVKDALRHTEGRGGENKPEATESEKVTTPGKAFPKAQHDTPRKTTKI